MMALKKWPEILRRGTDPEPGPLPDENEVDLDTLSVEDLHPTGATRRRQVVRSPKAAGARKASPLMPVLLGALALVCLAVGIFFGYSWFFGGGQTGDVPVVQAMNDPVKVKPENPGGLKVPYQDQLVLNQEDEEDETLPVVERLLPPPEAPQPPPREPEAAAPVEPPPAAPDTPNTDELAAAASRAVRNTQVVEAPVPDQSELLVVTPPAINETPQAPAPAKPAKPARAQTAAAVGTAPAKGSYVVQLGSFTSTGGSEQAWAKLQKAHPELLGDMSLFVQRATVNDRTYYRVQAGPVPNRATAMDMCAQLKARKQDCLVVRR